MRFATADARNRASEYLTNARRRNEALDWKRLTRRRLAAAWEDGPDALYDYL